MEYHIGCPIPRYEDCPCHLRCIKGLYCKNLRVIEGKRQYTTTLGGDDYKLFSNREEAIAYLEEFHNS